MRMFSRAQFVWALYDFITRVEIVLMPSRFELALQREQYINGYKFIRQLLSHYSSPNKHHHAH